MKFTEKLRLNKIKRKLLTIIAALLLFATAVLIFAGSRITYLLDKNAEERLDAAVTAVDSEINKRKYALTSITSSLYQLNSIGGDETEILHLFGLITNKLSFYKDLFEESSMYRKTPKIMEVHGVLNAGNMNSELKGYINLVYSAKGVVNYDRNPENEVWFKKAEAANGKIVVVPKYKNRNNEYAISLAQAFYKEPENKNLVGVVAVDCVFETFSDAVSPYVSGSGNIAVLDENLETIGKGVRNGNLSANGDGSNIPDIIKDRIKNASRFKTDKDIVFVKDTGDGFKLVMFVPYAEYYGKWFVFIIAVCVLTTLFTAALLFILFKTFDNTLSYETRYINKLKFFNLISKKNITLLNSIVDFSSGILKDELNIYTRYYITKIMSKSKELISIDENSNELYVGESGKKQANKSEETGANDFALVKYNTIELLNTAIGTANIIDTKIEEINLKNKSKMYLESDFASYSPLDFSINLEPAKTLAFKISVNPEVPRTLSGDKNTIDSAVKLIIEEAVFSCAEGDITLRIDRNFIDFNDTEIIISVEFNTPEIADGDKTDNIRMVLLNKICENAGIGFENFESEFEHYKRKKLEIRIVQKILDITPVGSDTDDGTTCFYKTFSAPSAKILIIGKDENENLLAKCLLTPFSLQVDSGKSIDDAMSKIGYRIEYDIIFVPHNMNEVLTSIRRFKDGDKTAVIATTAGAYDGDTAKRYSMKGFDGVIRFPFEYASLYNILMYRIPKSKIVTNQVTPGDESDALQFSAMQSEIRTLIPDIHLDDALLFSGGPRNFVRVLTKFVNSAEVYNNSIYSAVTLFERREYLAKFGELKKICVTLGLRELYNKAHELETSAKNGDFDFCIEHTTAFTNEITRIKNIAEKLSVIRREEVKPEDEND